MRWFSLLLFMLLAPTAYAQSYETIRSQYPGALETTTTSATYIYAAPDLTSDLVGRYQEGREVLAYQKQGDFYAVASERQGHVGYILLTALDVPQVPGAAVAPPLQLGYRNPAAARRMGILIPGAGHLFAGETTTGTALLLIGGGGLIGGYALSARTSETDCSSGTECITETNYTALIAGAVIAAGAWVYSALDADDAARRNNQRRGLDVQAGLAPGMRPTLALRITW